MVCLWEEAITAASGDNWPHEGGTGMYSMSAVSVGPSPPLSRFISWNTLSSSLASLPHYTLSHICFHPSSRPPPQLC